LIIRYEEEIVPTEFVPFSGVDQDDEDGSKREGWAGEWLSDELEKDKQLYL